MHRHRFYAAPSSFTETTVRPDADEAHHLTRVLRLGSGAQVFVFDGEGVEHECEVARVAKHEGDLNLLRRLDDVVESPLRLPLAQALIKGVKLDWVVEKATDPGRYRKRASSARREASRSSRSIATLNALKIGQGSGCSVGGGSRSKP